MTGPGRRLTVFDRLRGRGVVPVALLLGRVPVQLQLLPVVLVQVAQQLDALAGRVQQLPAGGRPGQGYSVTCCTTRVRASHARYRLTFTGPP